MKQYKKKKNENQLSLGATGAANGAGELTAERDELVLRLNNEKDSRKHLERKRSEQKHNGKALKASLKQLGKNVGFSENEYKPLQKKNNNLIGCHNDRDTVVKTKVKGWLKAFLSLSLKKRRLLARLFQNAVRGKYRSQNTWTSICDRTGKNFWNDVVSFQ